MKSKLLNHNKFRKDKVYLIKLITVINKEMIKKLIIDCFKIITNFHY
jgi:hypothetical protein